MRDPGGSSLSIFTKHGIPRLQDLTGLDGTTSRGIDSSRILGGGGMDSSRTYR